MVGNSLKQFKDMYLDDVLHYIEDYKLEDVRELLMLIPDAMKYKEGYKPHAKVFFSDIDKVDELPEAFIYRFQFDGKQWIYSYEKEGDKLLKKIKLHIKEQFDKE